ncbi:Werner Syndrome-like exonuclease [Brachypodium distachyon]|uniref:3'-5' exonuclease domain-containing protein n=1 Tax=Brachypodium distachyon TaxID=15368 RepID=I1H900_BRADI|nr:Werner Syndrome-like exonuclease [Brachypodium distachyon]KQK23303.1 hypothetical protein BRADI_1g72550v3 [Brachypodium distachyon]|eukprot:XP_003561987.1 Werner Syndrome-like exonuclease [Brachypodium distachyon]
MTTARYTVRFSSALIDTTVTSDAAAADEWARSVRASNPSGSGILVGLDCEWKPCDHLPVPSKVAILQLCVGTSCLILQMFYVDRVPAGIRSFLGDPTVRCVGIGVGEDCGKLAVDYGIVCAAPVDLEDRCNQHLGIRSLFRNRLGLKGYTREILGLTMAKPRHVTMSNWETRDLSVAQVVYACIDAYVSYKLGERLLDN